MGYAAPKVERKDVNTSAIVHKSFVFREVSLNLGKCRSAMIAILQALAQDASFTERERTDLFFSLTQLFHSKDQYIHRLLLLLLKLVPVNSRDSIIITHSLSKDISGAQLLPQGHAIRTLFAILEPTNVLSLERFLKLSIVSQVPYTASAVLSGAMRLVEGDKKDAVLRWVPEIRQASKSSNRSVRLHALRLLHALRSDDSYAAAQLAASLDEPKSQLEQLVAMSIMAQSMKLKQGEKELSFISRGWVSGPPMLRLEAVRKTPKELLGNTVDVLQSLMNGSAIMIFAAVRTIAESPNIQVYESLLPEILKLMKHSNASIAASAAICVLKLGNERHVELVSKRILSNCKRWAGPLVRAVAEESCKFAGKFHNDSLTEVAVYLLRVSRDQASKFAVLRALLTTEGIPHAFLLPRLSEYLEDHDSASVARAVCDFLAGQVETLEDPDSLIPVLFNRINLDESSVRMAAVNTLAAIAVKCNGMKEKVLPLLELLAADEDDNLRDQVILLLNAIKNNLPIEFTPFVIAVKEEKKEVETTAPGSPESSQKHDSDATGFVPAMMLDELEKYGKLEFKTDPVDMTDPDSEFVVSYFVNVFEKHLVLEFLVTNTVESMNLENVSIHLDDADVIDVIQAPSIKYQQTASTCCVLKRDKPMVYGIFKATLLYTQEDDDAEEEYALDAVILGTQTWLRPTKVDLFEDKWEELGDSDSTLVMQIPKVRSAAQGVQRVEEVLGLAKVSEEKDRKKTSLQLSGTDIEGNLVLVMAQIGIAKRNVVCRLAVRSSSADLSESILQSVSF